MAEMSKLGFTQRVDDLIRRLPESLNAFEQENLFTGPSLYFHDKTIELRRQQADTGALLADTTFVESLYATLTAWGLHRMGRNNVKLVSFDVLHASLQQQVKAITALQHLSITEIEPGLIDAISWHIWKIIASMEVSIAGVKIVAGSKALHHILPDLVPPIDRTYTLQFFYNNTNINRDEGEIFAEMYRAFCRIALQHKAFIERKMDAIGWNTSPTKVIDNAIIGYMVMNRQPVDEEPPEDPLPLKAPQATLQNNPAILFLAPPPAAKPAPAQPHHPPQPTPPPVNEPERPKEAAGQIVWGVRKLVLQGKQIFTRQDVRQILGIDNHLWNHNFSPIFQAMRVDQPGGAPPIAQRYRGLFQQVRRGEYRLTDYGREFILGEKWRMPPAQNIQQAIRDHVQEKEPDPEQASKPSWLRKIAAWFGWSIE